MLKNFAAIVSGFILWSALWVSYNAILKNLLILPSDETKPINDLKPLLLLLIGSIVISLAAGYLAAIIAQSESVVPIILLGLLLLAAGIFFQAQYWRLMPLWYHLSFLVLLLPLSLIGAKLSSS